MLGDFILPLPRGATEVRGYEVLLYKDCIRSPLPNPPPPGEGTFFTLSVRVLLCGVWFVVNPRVRNDLFCQRSPPTLRPVFCFAQGMHRHGSCYRVVDG